MEIDEDNSLATPVADSSTSAPVSDNQSAVSIGNGAIPLPPVPPFAPIPFVSSSSSIPRPLAPIPAPVPVRPPPPPPPPSVRVAAGQNGETETNGSDSDEADGRSGRAAAAAAAVEYEISEDSRLAKERHEKAKQELLLRRRAVALAVPTNDMAVRARLRGLGEPITFFGEREMERRDRLRMLMARLDGEGQLERLMKAIEDEEAAASAVSVDGVDEDVEYPFYTEGSKELLKARKDIASYSIVKAALRLRRARRRRDDPDEDMDAEIDWALKQAGSMALDDSEIGDDRPLSGCSLSPDGQMFATCSLSGVTKLWSIPSLQKASTLKGHNERATDVEFHPTGSFLATASADKTARLWSTDGILQCTYKGHLDRLARIGFHPSGRYLGTTSYDKTWRLWHVETHKEFLLQESTGNELLLQEGHSRSVYGISFHNDGSLVASCGLDALVRVWDLRSGRSILALEGHVKPVLGVSFSPNGYHLASGGEDNTCRIWDLRKRRSLYVIPAHSNLISQVKFEPQEGYFLVTGSYDMTAKVWSSKDFKPIKTLAAHEAKVTALDVAADGQRIATVSHDRTIKLWSPRNDDKGKEMDIDQ